MDEHYFQTIAIEVNLHFPITSQLHFVSFLPESLLQPHCGTLLALASLKFSGINKRNDERPLITFLYLQKAATEEACKQGRTYVGAMVGYSPGYFFLNFFLPLLLSPVPHLARPLSTPSPQRPSHSPSTSAPAVAPTPSPPLKP